MKNPTKVLMLKNRWGSLNGRESIQLNAGKFYTLDEGFARALATSGSCVMRVTRKRTRGWKMPENTVYVGRGSRFGNDFVVGEDGAREEVIQKFAKQMLPYTHQSGSLEDFYVSEANLNDIETLKGKNLACWCKADKACHADLLLEWANLPISKR